ncbi:MAG: hypothetical protein Q8L86_06355 [Vicinamibacterales bacterium]|nr:hypothetical protein [Vicinamibacterales bacterium]
MTIVVEVKQLEPNNGDRELAHDAVEGGSASCWVDMGRARQSILDGVKQLRAHAKGRHPALVVLYEVVDLLDYLGADSIAQCMYGPERVHVAVPHAPDAEPWVLGASYGGGRVVTASHNTTLSAVAVLRRAGDAETLSVFHNAYAAIPLNPDQFQLDGVRHFVWQARDDRHLPYWVEVTSPAA